MAIEKDTSKKGLKGKYIRTAEIRAKSAKVHQGINRKRFTDEHCNKIKEARLRLMQSGISTKKIPITLNGIEYPSKAAACKDLKINYSYLQTLLKLEKE